MNKAGSGVATVKVTNGIIKANESKPDNQGRNRDG